MSDESYSVSDPIDVWLDTHGFERALGFEEFHGVRKGMIVLSIAWHNEYNEWLDPQMLYKIVNLRF